MKRVLASLVLVGCGDANVNGTVNANGNTVSANVPVDSITGNKTEPAGVCVVGLSLEGVAVCSESSTDNPTTQIIKDGVITTVLDPTSAFSIASVQELPVCCPEKDGALVFIKDTSSFKTCSDNQWSDIDLRGERGEVGQTGAQGIQGQNGEQGIQGVAGINGIQGAAGVDGIDGQNGQNGVDGQDIHIVFSQICDGNFGNVYARVHESGYFWNDQITTTGSVHTEYHETSYGDKQFSARIVSDDFTSFDVSFSSQIAKNQPRNNYNWSLSPLLSPLGQWNHIFSVNKVNVNGSARFIFYPSRLGASTPVASRLATNNELYEIEGSNFTITNLLAGRLNTTNAIGGGIACYNTWY
jgi:hypothetical protein